MPELDCYGKRKNCLEDDDCSNCFIWKREQKRKMEKEGLENMDWVIDYITEWIEKSTDFKVSNLGLIHKPHIKGKKEE